MLNTNSYIEVDTQFQGLHHWPECVYKEVEFLKNIHRHIIFISVRIQIKEDRGIEFFMLKDFIDNSIIQLYGSDNTKNLGRRSMEEIGHDLLLKLTEKYGETYYLIKVSEDNQVRGIVEYEGKIN